MYHRFLFPDGFYCNTFANLGRQGEEKAVSTLQLNQEDVMLSPRKKTFATLLVFSFLAGVTACTSPPPANEQAEPEARETTRESLAPTHSTTPTTADPGGSMAHALSKQVAAEHARAPFLAAGDAVGPWQQPAPWNQESYAATVANRFLLTANDPLSTFSIDVDTASYTNIRRFLQGGSLPPVGAVRVEEMLNYFHYSYPLPKEEPIGIYTEIGPCPWQPEHRLAHIGISSKELTGQLPPSNLVFLIDVSGSMNHPDKLPLLKQSLLLLADQLSAKDRLAIVVYAGTDSILLQPTPGSDRQIIKNAITSLGAGGATHGSKGIETAYQLAVQNFIQGGNNRVILASDGDFNVGVTSRGELKRVIEEKRETGVYLTVLGFGMGNYHDDTMEILADAGNGNYAYIDSLLEAKKVLLKERASTLHALASDVKIQVEFNPVTVGAYRLLGYENRMLQDEDFADDTVDAGEIGFGHTVTALYEIIPPEGEGLPVVAPLKYQKATTATADTAELLTVNVRYKQPVSQVAHEVSQALQDSSRALADTSNTFRFAAAVAGFGLLLRDSPLHGDASYQMLIELARNSRGDDPEGYRSELLRLLETAQLLSSR